MPGNLNLKKSWHPGLIKNQKKIWEQEQNALDEHLKIKAKNEELKAEREKQELIRLQYGDSESAPLEAKRELNKLGWMYDDNKPKEEGFNEVEDEFLLGKKKVESMLSGNQALEVAEKSRFETIIDNPKRKSGADLNDDPLLKIKQVQAKKSRHKHRDTGVTHGKDKGSNRDRSPSRGESKHRASRDSSEPDERHKSRNHSKRDVPSYKNSRDEEKSTKMTKDARSIINY
ncbi:Piso0_005150 [Millerozyma farinosa CBS 7064]|uniref:Pre-mRNA-splicing factor CWC25 n=1 Tax=Pichia sorbitophila (strain ATCC MYA-4447 / BCRC 22081 / CBS 7064 / NBRC 10061 / NRRL Y-12695) TaxID=559304 RepID=G8Y1E4_PICSO|nr:Piso0_005150 [Millerozyma farinosa CBS 7064]